VLGVEALTGLGEGLAARPEIGEGAPAQAEGGAA
jgi:hypothetical protein